MPRWIRYLFLFAASAASVAGSSQNVTPVESGSRAEAPRLEPIFSDDFSKDTRADYTIKGDVHWEPFKLTLSEGASIERAVNGGAWAKVKLKLDEVMFSGDGRLSELRIWFLLDGATSCFVRLQIRAANDGEKMGSVALIDTGEHDGQPAMQIVREVPWPVDSVQDMTITYRHGLVQVETNGLPILIAYIENFTASVAAIQLQAMIGPHSVTDFACQTNPAAVQLSEEQLRQLAETEELNERAISLHTQGEFADSLIMFAESLEVRRSILGKQHPDYTTSLGNLAVLCFEIADYTRAEPLFRQNIRIQKAVLGEQHPDYATSLDNLATLYRRLAEFTKAEPLYRQAMEIRKSAFGDTHPDYATSLNNIAGLYFDVADYSRAEPLYRQSLEILKSVIGEQHADYARRLANLAVLYATIGDYSRAAALHRQAMEIQKSALGEQHPQYGVSLLNFAGLLSDMADYAGAEQLCRHSMEIQKTTVGEGHPDYARSLHCLARLYYKIGEYSNADRHYSRELQIRKSALGEQHPDYAMSLDDLAILRMAMGDFDGARSSLLHSCEVLTTVAANSLPTLSEAQARNWMSQYNPGTDLLLATLRRLNESGSPEAYRGVWTTKSMISRLRVGQSAPDGSSPEALQVFAELRDARQNLASLVSATPSPDQAEVYREALATASVRKEELERRLGELNPASKRELTIRDAEIEDLLQQLPPGVAVVDFVHLNDVDFVEHEITLNKKDGTIEKRTVKKAHEAAVYDAFVLRWDRIDTSAPAEWIPLGSAEPIEDAIGAWREQISGIVAETDAATSSRIVIDPQRILRQLIWDRLEPALAGCHTVILLPDGDLNRLPWSALPGREPGTFLIEEYTIAIAAYGQQVFGLLTDDAFTGSSQLLVAGGIRYDQRPDAAPGSFAAENDPLLASTGRSIDLSAEERSWRYLNGAAEEAKVVASLWRDRGPITLVEGSQADEQAIAMLLPRSRFAHLATHGFFDKSAEVYRVNLREQSLFHSNSTVSQRGATVAARNPLLMTGIVLAGANLEPQKDDLGLPTGSDGILTAEEIQGLNLHNSELVTLSACETGLGDVAAGDGVYGLTRALHQAGVRTVVTSLWKVDDRATQELMTQFYTNLWVKNQSKVDALRNAQLYLLRNPVLSDGTRLTRGDINKAKPVVADPATNRDATDPFFWAAWTLSGDWR